MMAQRGSVFVLILIVMSVLSVATVALWYSHQCLVDIALNKQLYEQRWRLTEAALRIGHDYVNKNMKRLFSDSEEVGGLKSKTDQSVTFKLGAWPPNKGEYQARIMIAPIKDTIRVSAKLYAGSKVVCTIVSKVVADGSVCYWKINPRE